MFGLGKSRSKLGKFIDRHSITTTEFAKESGVNRKTIGRLCNERDYIPSQNVMKKILTTVRKVDPEAKSSDFWEI